MTHLRFRLLFLTSLIFLTMSESSTFSQTVVPLWDGPAPQSHGTTPDDIPTLTIFLPSNVTAPTSAIVICPGGGYAMLSFDFEGINEAKWFQQKGVAAFVLRYRLPVNGYRHPVPMLDVQRALRLVRAHAGEWQVDTTKLGIMGFSAGGHLAATADTHFDAGDPKSTDLVDRQSCRPDFAVLVYAVISMKDGVTHQGSKVNLLGPNPDPALVANLSNETQVTAQTPPTVLVHSLDDHAVPIENSRLMYAALQQAGVPSALQEYPHGGHGFGLGHVPDPSPAGWLDQAYAWLQGQHWVP